jgi:hypothetical protein
MNVSRCAYVLPYAVAVGRRSDMAPKNIKKIKNPEMCG